MNQEKLTVEDFSGGPVVKNPAASAGNTGSISNPGRFHMLLGLHTTTKTQQSNENKAQPLKKSGQIKTCVFFKKKEKQLMGKKEYPLSFYF